MGKDKKIIEHIKADRSMFNSDKDYNDYLAFVKRAEELEMDYYKRQRRLRIFGFIMIGFVISLVVVAILSIIFPSLQPFSDIYFLVCNILSIGLCAWSFYTLMKTKKEGNIKDKSFTLFIVFSIFALLLNVGIVINELFFDII